MLTAIAFPESKTSFPGTSIGSPGRTASFDADPLSLPESGKVLPNSPPVRYNHSRYNERPRSPFRQPHEQCVAIERRLAPTVNVAPGPPPIEHGRSAVGCLVGDTNVTSIVVIVAILVVPFALFALCRCPRGSILTVLVESLKCAKACVFVAIATLITISSIVMSYGIPPGKVLTLVLPGYGFLVLFARRFAQFAAFLSNSVSDDTRPTLPARYKRLHRQTNQ